MTVLLVIALATTVLAAVSTIQAFQDFQQQHALVKAGDVRSIRSWMTIPYVAHLCHVPESYLYDTLHLTASTPLSNHLTLHMLAFRSQRPVDFVVSEVQRAIIAYRKKHPAGRVHPPPVHSKTRSLQAGRMAY